jgi:hypothetical protein
MMKPAEEAPIEAKALMLRDRKAIVSKHEGALAREPSFGPPLARLLGMRDALTKPE